MSQSPSNAQWTIKCNTGLDGLQLTHDVHIPQPSASECLIRIHAASLNYRDLAVASGNYPLLHSDTVVPCSDAAGEIVAVGPSVSRWARGDRVCPIFMQAHLEGNVVTPAIRQTSLGTSRDGVLQRYVLCAESGLVRVPRHLSFGEAATLPCAGVTAWNCLFGLATHALREGQWVLTLGTGGVSLFAVQFAVACGANVIATTSSPEKEEKLRALGVKHVINYREGENWGQTARDLTPDGLGVHHVVEVGGETTIPQSMTATRPDGVVSLMGFLGGSTQSPASYWLIQKQLAIVRGVNVGSRKHFEDMVEFIETHQLRPIISEPIVSFDDARVAYERLQEQKFFGKIVIET